MRWRAMAINRARRALLRGWRATTGGAERLASPAAPSDTTAAVTAAVPPAVAADQAVAGRWTNRDDTDSRTRRAATLADLLGMAGVRFELVTLAVLAADAESSVPEDVIVATPGSLMVQVERSRPTFVLIDESALSQEPWGDVDTGPHPRTVQEIEDLAASLGPADSPLVRVLSSVPDQMSGPFDLDNGYQQIRRVAPLGVEAASLAEAMETLQQWRAPRTWEGPA